MDRYNRQSRELQEGFYLGFIRHGWESDEMSLFDNDYNEVMNWTNVGNVFYNSNVYPDWSLLQEEQGWFKLFGDDSSLIWQLWSGTSNSPGFYDWMWPEMDLNQHHDAWIIPGGIYPGTDIGDKLILTMGSDWLEPLEAIEMGRNPDYSGAFESGYIHILKINPDGGHGADEGDTSGADVLWEWYMRDHFVQDFDSSKENYVSDISNHPNKIDINMRGEGGYINGDFTHFNTVHYNPFIGESGSVVISSRTMGDGEFYVIDITTGEIIFRCCNPQNWGGGTPQDRVTNHQHGVNWIPEEYPNGGDIIFFNNNGTPDISPCAEGPDWINPCPALFGSDYCCGQGPDMIGLCAPGEWCCSQFTFNSDSEIWDCADEYYAIDNASQVIKVSPTYDGSMNYEVTGIVEHVNPPPEGYDDNNEYPPTFNDPPGYYWMGATGGAFPLRNGNIIIAMGNVHGIFEVENPWTEPTLIGGVQGNTFSDDNPNPWNDSPAGIIRMEARPIKYVCDEGGTDYWYGLTLDCEPPDEPPEPEEPDFLIINTYCENNNDPIGCPDGNHCICECQNQSSGDIIQLCNPYSCQGGGVECCNISSGPGNNICEQLKMGDINRDLNIDILDVVAVANIVIQGESNFTPVELELADLNHDGNIDVLDIVALVNIILGNTRTTASERKELQRLLDKLNRIR